MPRTIKYIISFNCQVSFFRQLSIRIKKQGSGVRLPGCLNQLSDFRKVT